jgi:CrcB protein
MATTQSLDALRKLRARADARVYLSDHTVNRCAPHSAPVQGLLMRAILAISCGASLGALLRWWLGTGLNAHFPQIPPGTLAANLIGGYVVGIAIAFFATYSALAPEWRLFVITGFCGGLTTFSTFSAEIVGLMQQGRTGWALGAAAAHLVGSVIMTFAGIGTVALARS